MDQRFYRAGQFARKAAVSPGTTVTYARGAGGIDSSYDVAIVVVGETPYAEWYGDRLDDLRLDEEDRATLAAVKRAGVPAVVIMVSGRPLVVTQELPDWRAFVAAWLPGSEGEGVADVLFGRVNPGGKLPISLPVTAGQVPVYYAHRPSGASGCSCRPHRGQRRDG